ncbi:MAG: TOBE domain-containing protein, partial [Nitriliruptoraceae bacterium]
VHPRAVALHTAEPSGSTRNQWRARIDSIDLHGSDVRVHLEGGVSVVAQITAAGLAELGAREGDAVWVAVKASEIDTWPA